MMRVGWLLVIWGLLVGAAPAPKPMTWLELGKLNYRTGKMPDALSERLQAQVKIEGFVIPLDGDGKGVSAFILVSDPMYCAHVPPPPPNQMVYVELKKPKPWSVLGAGSVLITGKLTVIDEESDFGGHMYAMKKITEIKKGSTKLNTLF